MKFKLGGGNYLQPYDEKNGQYTDGDCLKVKEKDLENLVLKYIYGLDYKNLTFHFPNYKIHDEVYCELFIKYVRQFIKNDDVIIQPEKMKYLLLCKFKDDKSAFFKKIGYSEFDSERLMNDIRRNTKFETSSFKRINKYTFNFEAKTILNNYTVTTAWQLNEDGDVRLITVIPGGRQDMEMNIKMGNIVKTLVDKRGNWGSTVVFIPKGTLCLVCEVYDNGAISVEAPDSMPFALVDYEKSEYEKVEYFKKS